MHGMKTIGWAILQAPPKRNLSSTQLLERFPQISKISDFTNLRRVNYDQYVIIVHLFLKIGFIWMVNASFLYLKVVFKQCYQTGQFYSDKSC